MGAAARGVARSPMPSVPLRPLLLSAVLALVWVAPGLGPGAAAAQSTRVRLSDGQREVVILADRIQQLGGAQSLLIAEGDVELTVGRSRLLADRVELDPDTGDAVARGRVIFYDGQDRLEAALVEYNVRTGTGVIHDGSLTAAPIYRLSGQRMERVGEGVYSVRHCTFTTCEGPDPAWAFRIGAGTAELDSWVYGRDVSFLVGGIPVIPWLPFFAAPMLTERQSGFLPPVIGVSGTKGFFASVPYYWAIDDSQDLTVALEVQTKRGVGFYGDYRYILAEENRGELRAYYLNEVFDDGANRAFVTGQHTWNITPRLALKADVNWTSDDDVFRDYADRLPVRGQALAQTNLFLAQRWDAWSLVGNVLWYQDLTTPERVELERVPAINLWGMAQPVPWFGPLLYEAQSSLTNFVRDVGPGGLRVDLHPRVLLPIPVGGWFTVTPWVGGRATLYTERVVGTSVTASGTPYALTVNDARVRAQLELGLDAETRAARVYAVDGWAGLQALQHVIEPRVSVLAIRGVNQTDVPQYDPATSTAGQLRWAAPGIDSIGKTSAVGYSLTNRLYAKTAAAPGQEPYRWELARFTLSQIFDVMDVGSEPWKDVYGELLLQSPGGILRLRGALLWNIHGLGPREGVLDTTVTLPRASATVGLRFSETSNISTLHAELTARLLDNLDVRASTDWDTRQGTAVESRAALIYRSQCWAIMVEYVSRNNLNENEVRLAVNLLGLGELGTKVGIGGL